MRKGHARPSVERGPTDRILGVPARLFLPYWDPAQERPELRARRWGIVQRVNERVMALGVEHKQPLVEQHFDRLPPGALDHELGARLAEHFRGVIDELAGVRLDAQIDAALRI